MKFLLPLILLYSCSLFKTHTVDRDLSQSTKRICLSSEGKGRLVVQNRKYIFSYDSILEKKLAHWELALNFPLRKTETFKLDWSKSGKVDFTSTIEEKLLKENKNLDPRSIEEFTSGLGNLLEEIIKLRTAKKLKSKKFSWSSSKKSLIAKSRNKSFNAVFTNLGPNGHFGLMRLSYQNSGDQAYKMDLVVRKCLESRQSD